MNLTGILSSSFTPNFKNGTTRHPVAGPPKVNLTSISAAQSTSTTTSKPSGYGSGSRSVTVTSISSENATDNDLIMGIITITVIALILLVLFCTCVIVIRRRYHANRSNVRSLSSLIQADIASNAGRDRDVDGRIRSRVSNLFMGQHRRPVFENANINFELVQFPPVPLYSRNSHNYSSVPSARSDFNSKIPNAPFSNQNQTLTTSAFSNRIHSREADDIFEAEEELKYQNQNPSSASNHRHQLQGYQESHERPISSMSQPQKTKYDRDFEIITKHDFQSRPRCHSVSNPLGCFSPTCTSRASAHAKDLNVTCSVNDSPFKCKFDNHCEQLQAIIARDEFFKSSEDIHGSS